MSKFSNIIPIGAHCNISYLLQHLHIKKETSLFEWFQSDGLDCVNETLNKINWTHLNSDIITGKDDLIELVIIIYSQCIIKSMSIKKFI